MSDLPSVTCLMLTKVRRGRVYDDAYRDWVRGFACIVCARGDMRQSAYPSEAAHVGERGLGQKCSDRETLPMCSWHHRRGPESHHAIGARFWAHHGLDREKLIAGFNAAYERR